MKPFPAIHSLTIVSLFFFALACKTPATESKDVVRAMPLIANHGLHIDYTDTGSGDTTLFFVHGWCLNKSYWSSQVAFFKNRYRIVTIDLAGFGASGKNRAQWSTENYAADVDSVMTALNLRNVILIGHSMAGAIVMETAVIDSARVIGLVGVDNFKSIGEAETAESKAQNAQAMNELRHHFTKVAFEYMNMSLFSPTTADSIRKRILNDVSKADSIIAVAALESETPDVVKTLLQTNKRLFLINSDVQPLDSSGFVANKIPFHVDYIHGSGHFPMVEHPEAFNAALQRDIVAGK